LVTAFVPIVISFLWYHPKIFGTRFVALSGIIPNSEIKTSEGGMFLKMFLNYLLWILTTYMMAVLVLQMIVAFVFPAILLGFQVWLAFVLAFFVSSNMYEAKPKPAILLAINLGYYLFSLCVVSVILAVWL
jgi:hypothetical protein